MFVFTFGGVLTIGCDNRLLVKLIELGCELAEVDGAVVPVPDVLAGEAVAGGGSARPRLRLRNLLPAWAVRLVAPGRPLELLLLLPVCCDGPA